MRVFVIGAGVLGVSTAYFLRQHGMDVTVLESEDNAALGASYGNGGLLQTGAPDPWNGPGAFKLFAKAWLAGLTGRGSESAFLTRTSAIPGLVGFGLKFLKNSTLETYLSHTVKNRRLAEYTRTVLNELNERESLAYNYKECGSLLIHRAQESLDSYAEFSAHMASHGTRFEVFDREQLVQKEPSLSEISDQLVGGVFFPDDAGGSSRDFCRQLAAVTEANGVNFEHDVSVSSIKKYGARLKVHSNQGELTADKIVIAAGAGSKEIASSLGLSLPIAPAKGYSISVPMNDWSNRPTHIIADMGVHAGVNPIGSILRVAGTAEFAGMRHGISKERTNYLINLVRQIFPTFAEGIDPATIDPWGGLRPLCADGIPIMGSCEVDGVFLNTGHGGVGWTQAAGSGKAVADVVAGVEPDIELSDYSLDRFK